MNGRSSTAQPAVVTLLVGTWQDHSKAIKRNNIVPGLLIKRRRASGCTESHGRSHFSLRFLPLRHSISQHFIVLLMRQTRQENGCSCGTEGRCYSRPAPAYR